MVNACSMRNASNASFSLRSKVTSLLRRKFLATCWVIVEAPTGRRSFSQPVQVGEHGADDAQRVETRMRVEVLVLGGEERLDHSPGNGIDGYEHPLLVCELGQQAAVPSMHSGHGRWLIVGELAIVRQARGVAMHQIQGTAARGQGTDNHSDGQHTEQLHHSAQRTPSSSRFR